MERRKRNHNMNKKEPRRARAEQYAKSGSSKTTNLNFYDLIVSNVLGSSKHLP